MKSEMKTKSHQLKAIENQQPHEENVSKAKENMKENGMAAASKKENGEIKKEIMKTKVSMKSGIEISK